MEPYTVVKYLKQLKCSIKVEFAMVVELNLGKYEKVNTFPFQRLRENVQVDN